MLTFNADRHEYRYHDRVVPHVTQICAMLGDYASGSAAVMEHARDRGQAVHLATELYDIGELDGDSVPAEVRPYLEAWVLFREETGFIFSECELPVYEPTYRFAGRVDRIGTFQRLRGVHPATECLVDIKATYQIAAQVAVQTALYAFAYTGKLSMPRFGVQLRNDGTYRLHRFQNRSDFSVGLAALTLHNWKERHATNTND